jgi:hypothetical protein
VVHGGGSDVLWLQRDFGLFLVNVFDTEKACQARCGHAVVMLRRDCILAVPPPRCARRALGAWGDPYLDS